MFLTRASAAAMVSRWPGVSFVRPPLPEAKHASLPCGPSTRARVVLSATTGFASACSGGGGGRASGGAGRAGRGSRTRA